MSRERNTFNEINITPLTDIFLVLLIIMMVIAPLLDQQGLNLAVPNNVEVQDINFFLDLAELDTVSEIKDIPNSVLIPAFMLGELRKSFIIGFLIYIPFIVIDMVVASSLMSMGMMMLPPTTISMPFKILLFVLADGWNLVIVNLVTAVAACVGILMAPISIHTHNSILKNRVLMIILFSLFFCPYYTSNSRQDAIVF